MLPRFREEVVGLEGEELMAGTSAAGEVCLHKMPPFLGNGCGGEGQEIARMYIVALSSQRRQRLSCFQWEGSVTLCA